MWFKKSGLLYQYITIFHLSLSPNHFLWEIISLILTNEYRSIHPSRHLCKGMRQNCELFPSIFHSFRHDQSRILKMYSLWNWQNKMTNALMIGKRNRIFICYREHSYWCKLWSRVLHKFLIPWGEGGERLPSHYYDRSWSNSLLILDLNLMTKLNPPPRNICVVILFMDNVMVCLVVN